MLWIGVGWLAADLTFAPTLRDFDVLVIYALQLLLAVLIATVFVSVLLTQCRQNAPKVMLLLVSFTLSSLALDWKADALFDWSHWLLLSSRYKEQLLTKSTVPDEMRHVHWNSWGFAGNETEVYLVFDPSDGLHEAAKDDLHTGPGLPCKVWRVRRFEKNWYAVTFYTDEGWDGCDAR